MHSEQCRLYIHLQEKRGAQQKTKAQAWKSQRGVNNENDREREFIAELKRNEKTTATRKKRHPLDTETLKTAQTKHSKAKRSPSGSQDQFSSRHGQRTRSKTKQTRRRINTKLNWQKLNTVKGIKHRSQYNNESIQQNKDNQIIACNHAETANST